MQQHFKTLVSSIGLAVVAVALVLTVGLIAVLPSWRVDLTENDLYSLSPGTRAIVTNLEFPIKLMFFYSESLTEDQPQLRTYADRVQEFLEEIVIASGGDMTLEVVDPQPFSEAEDEAVRFGVRAVALAQNSPEIYFGLAAQNAGEPGEDNPFAGAAATPAPDSPGP